MMRLESIHSTLIKTETALGQVVTLPIAPATTPSDYAHNVQGEAETDTIWWRITVQLQIFVVQNFREIAKNPMDVNFHEKNFVMAKFFS